MLEKLGEGSSGVVFKAQSENEKVFAVKKIKINSDSGMPVSLVREIKALKKLSSHFFVQLHEINLEKRHVCLVLDYMPFNLEMLISSKYKFKENQLSFILFQLFKAVEYMHDKDLIHRDLKPKHIFLDSKCNLKLSDFGQTRIINDTMTNKDISSLHYRAPELLLGATKYNHKIDSWSIGCIIYEMIKGEKLFESEDEIEQVKAILNKLGTPDIEYPWSDIYDVKKYKKSESFDSIMANLLAETFDEKTAQLIKELLHVSHEKRLSVKNACRLPVVLKGEEVQNMVEPLVIS